MGPGIAAGERVAASEAEITRALRRLPDGWASFHDVPWPGRAGLAIDHVVVGPPGVFVIEAESWSGAIEVRDHVLTHDGRSREQAVDLAARAAIAVQGIVPGRCFPVVCFSGPPMVAWAREVMVCSASTVLLKLLTLPARLSPDDVRRCADALQARTSHRPASRGPAWARTRDEGLRPRGRAVRALIGALSLLLAFLLALASGVLDQAAEWVRDGYAEVRNLQDEPVTHRGPHQDARR